MKKYQVIYEMYKESILSGILKYGDRVDSIRECVKKMNVSKTTVENAYNKLVLDGFISSQEKVGYVVSMNPERILLHQEILDYSSSHKEKSYEYDFRIQSVSFDSFETTIWKRYMKGVLNDKRLMSSYGLAQGEYGLRQALCKYVYQNRNILCFPEQMVIGSNYQSLLYIFCGMLDKSKVIGLSTLVDDQAKQVFLSYGFHVDVLKSRLNHGWHPDLALSKELKVIKKRKAPLTYKGETKTIREWAQTTGLHDYIIRARIKAGWPVERILTEDASPRIVVCNGEAHTVAEWSLLTGISKTTIRTKLNKGVSPEEIFKKRK